MHRRDVPHRPGIGDGGWGGSGADGAGPGGRAAAPAHVRHADRHRRPRRRRPCTTTSARCTTRSRPGIRRPQQYFDQGLRLTWGFNHDEAIASYTEATRNDSTCAMCWWGIAFAMGPNINAPMDTAAVKPAWEALQNAQKYAAKATPHERDFIAALAKRYVVRARGRAPPLDSAFSQGDGRVAKKYPSDPEAQTLYADAHHEPLALELLTPTGAPSRARRRRSWSRRSSAPSRSIPNHPGACHLYIHAVEASTTPARAVPCADRLAKLMPGAGHLVHMPSHIYMRTGRYDLVAAHNHDAVGQDETFIQDRKPAGFYKYTYYPHNYHMMYAGLMLLGRGAGDDRRGAEDRGGRAGGRDQAGAAAGVLLPDPLLGAGAVRALGRAAGRAGAGGALSVHHRDVALRRGAWPSPPRASSPRPRRSTTASWPIARRDPARSSRRASTRRRRCSSSPSGTSPAGSPRPRATRPPRSRRYEAGDEDRGQPGLRRAAGLVPPDPPRARRRCNLAQGKAGGGGEAVPRGPGALAEQRLVRSTGWRASLRAQGKTQGGGEGGRANSGSSGRRRT